MRWHEIINETSTAGATASGNIAMVPGNGGKGQGAIGAGFDPNGDWGIYNNAKKKVKSSKGKMLRR